MKKKSYEIKSFKLVIYGPLDKTGAKLSISCCKLCRLELFDQKLSVGYVMGIVHHFNFNIIQYVEV